jgi:hypothetical protein
LRKIDEVNGLRDAEEQISVEAKEVLWGQPFYGQVDVAALAGGVGTGSEQKEARDRVVLGEPSYGFSVLIWNHFRYGG